MMFAEWERWWDARAANHGSPRVGLGPEAILMNHKNQQMPEGLAPGVMSGAQPQAQYGEITTV